MNKAVITGVLGQDGSFMAQLLDAKGYRLVGIIRPNTRDKMTRVGWIKKLIPTIEIVEMDLTDVNYINELIQYFGPDEIYNFAAYSNVFNPWDNLESVFEINCKIPQNFLKSIVQEDKNIKFFQASSALIFGRTDTHEQDEKTAFAPLYPYGITKLYSHNLINEFREKYGLFCCAAIYFNHESERRGNNFFTKKVINGIKEIQNNKKDKLVVGDLTAYRDMGYAPDYMEATYAMMQNSIPVDYVVGTGNLIKMEDFIEKSFAAANLDWRDYIVYDSNFSRPQETQKLKANIKKIQNELGWYPKNNIDSIIHQMIEKTGE